MAISTGLPSSVTALPGLLPQDLPVLDFQALTEMLGGAPSGPAPDALLRQNQGAQLLRDVKQGNAELGAGWQGVAQGQSPEVKELLAARSDLKLEDLTDRGKLLPVVQDPETRQLLAQNASLRPADLAEMQSAISQSIKDPASARSAYRMALETLQGGGDIKPQALGQLFGEIAGAVGKSPESGPVALSMFGSARDMLKGGQSPEGVTALVQASKDIAGGDKNSAMGVANAFETAGKASATGQSPQEVRQLAGVLAQRFPGQDNSERTRAFESGLGMMSASPSLGAKGVDAMLARGQSQGLKGEKLLRSFDTQGQAMKEGRMSAATLADPNQKSLRFDQEGRLKPQETARPGQPQTARPGAPAREPGRVAPTAQAERKTA